MRTIPATPAPIATQILVDTPASPSVALYAWSYGVVLSPVGRGDCELVLRFVDVLIGNFDALVKFDILSGDSIEFVEARLAVVDVVVVVVVVAVVVVVISFK